MSQDTRREPERECLADLRGYRAGGSVKYKEGAVNASSSEAAPSPAACGILTAGSQHRFGEAWSENVRKDRTRAWRGKLMGGRRDQG